MPTSSVSQQSPRRFDLLQVPYLGPVLLWKHSRTVAQAIVFVMAMAIILDGLLGSPLAAKNVATVSAWVHYRGLVVLALLLFGNLFCAACPFLLPRRFAKWLGKPAGRWPKPLRNKWLAIGALIAIIFVYELFDLWASPWWTAWLAIAYFVAAFVLEALFTGNSFCKYLCPLGSFNFLYSTASPSQITARRAQICRDCVGHDCINGSSTQQGCQLELYVPTLASNMDCTLCLDCAKACPHDNVALVARPYGIELVHQTWPHRLDHALLAILLAFVALINAFAMTPPAYSLEIEMASLLNTESEAIVLGIIYLVGALLVPLALIYAAAWLSRGFTGEQMRLKRLIMRYAYAFVPLGFAIWIAHYLFHFLTGAMTLVPAVQIFIGETLGWPFLGDPNWQLAQSAVPPISLIQALQQIITWSGLAAALYVAWRAASRAHHSQRHHLGEWLLWAVLLVLLTVAVSAVFLLPMEMRGSVLSG
jgi:polyferredoxin